MRRHPEFNYKPEGAKEQVCRKIAPYGERYLCPFDVEEHPEYCDTCAWKGAPSQ